MQLPFFRVLHTHSPGFGGSDVFRLRHLGGCVGGAAEECALASDEESRGLPFWESTDVGASDDGAWDLVKGCLFAV